MICTPMTFTGANGRQYRVFPPIQNPFGCGDHVYIGKGTWRIEFYYNDHWGWLDLNNIDSRSRAVDQYFRWADGCEEVSNVCINAKVQGNLLSLCAEG